MVYIGLREGRSGLLIHACLQTHSCTRTLTRFSLQVNPASLEQAETKLSELIGDLRVSDEAPRQSRRKKDSNPSSSDVVTSSCVLRNVGPRFAKEASANKDARKEKKMKERKERRDSKKNGRNGTSGSGKPDDLHCSYCNVTFYNKVDFQNHCRSDRHQHTIMSDEGNFFLMAK